MMKLRKALLVITIIILIFTMPKVFAHTYNNMDFVRKTSDYTLDTKYEAAPFYPKEPETYNVDLDWNDLHLSFSHDASDTSKISNKWINNDVKLLRLNTILEEDLCDKKMLLEDASNKLNTSLIFVKNKSVFAIDVMGAIKENKRGANSNNYVKLAIANCGIDCDEKDLSFARGVNVSNLLNKNGTKFIVKPITGDIQEYNSSATMVVENVKLIFAKSD